MVKLELLNHKYKKTFTQSTRQTHMDRFLWLNALYSHWVIIFLCRHFFFTRTVWIGVKFYNGNWWNDDGYPLHFSNWAPNNPTGTGPCAIMNGDGHWQDNDCTGPAHFLCKVPHSSKCIFFCRLTRSLFRMLLVPTLVRCPCLSLCHQICKTITVTHYALSIENVF